MESARINTLRLSVSQQDDDCGYRSVSWMITKRSSSLTGFSFSKSRAPPYSLPSFALDRGTGGRRKMLSTGVRAQSFAWCCPS